MMQIEFNKDYKHHIEDFFRMPTSLRIKLYESFTFSDILNLPFKNKITPHNIELSTSQKNQLSRSGYYDLILDYLSLGALNDEEKRKFFDDLNHGRTPFFLDSKKVSKNLRTIKTPITPFTIQEEKIRYINCGGEKLRQEIVKKGLVKLTNKGLSFLTQLCPKLAIKKPIIIGR